MNHSTVRRAAVAASMLTLLALCGLGIGVRAEAPRVQPSEEAERFEVDHVFFFSQAQAPELAAFEEAGFLPHSYTNTHDDQGTAGRYIYFDNVYLELLWVADEEIAAANEKRCDTDMNARQGWPQREGVSPIGIGIRDHRYADAPPAREHKYKADWMGSGDDYLGVFTPEYRMNEPWVFRMPPGWTVPAREEFGERDRPFLEHPNGARELTNVVFTVVGENRLSKGLRELASDGKFSFTKGEEPFVEMTFDGGAQGETADFRPGIPLLIHY